jgi:HAD superfamily hydrolase (TIGR01490 family)
MSLYFSRIYGAYGSMEGVFSSSRVYELYRSLPEEDRSTFPFDVEEVDWKAWLQETHLPAITSKPGRKKRRAAAEEKPGEVAAIFDVDGTLVGSNVVSHYAWLKMRELPAALRPLWAASFIARVPFYWVLDKVSRTHFNRVFYKNYKGWKPARAYALGKESFSGYILKRLYPEALRTLRDHKEAGHRVVLLSGALDFILEPFEDLADDVLTARLEEENGVYTGELSGAPVAGEARARMLASFARRRKLDLSHSYAYADSISDLPMLEAVGNPVVVNPDRRLQKAAKAAWVAGQELEQERRYLGRFMVPGRRLLGRGVLALQYRKSVPRYLLMRAGAKRVKGLDTGRLSPLQLEEVAEPRLPTPDWVRLRPLLSGICGSDLGTLSPRARRTSRP